LSKHESVKRQKYDRQTLPDFFTVLSRSERDKLLHIVFECNIIHAWK